jgi:TetR/AcrR family transcriptional regulator
VGARISGTVQKRGSTPARPVRRIGGEKSKTRALILDAVERLMLREGYAAVTSRKVAGEANVTSQLVHYYFSTMDELFLALWRRFVRANMERQTHALTSPHALGAIWDFTCHAAGTALELEFIALAHHRKAIRREIARDGNRFRKLQIEALSHVMHEYGFEADEGFAEVLTVLLTSVSRSMIMEKDLGVSVGHARTFSYIEKWIDRLRTVQRDKAAKKRRPMHVDFRL